MSEETILNIMTHAAMLGMQVKICADGSIIMKPMVVGQQAPMTPAEKQKLYRQRKKESVTDEVTLNGENVTSVTAVTHDDDALPDLFKTDSLAENPPTPKPAKSAKSRIPTTPHALRLSELFRRKPTTGWTEPEVKAFKAIHPIDDSDLAAIEAYYSANWPPERDTNVLRHDLKTLLNNWPGEVDRANTWALNKTKPKAMNPSDLF